MLLLAVLVWFRFRPLSLALVCIALASLWLLSTRPVANLLMQKLEQKTALFPEQIPDSVEAIVILGTGVQSNTPEYNMAPQPGALLLQRLRYGIKIARETDLPILVSGGSPMGVNEADAMDRFLSEHGLSARWKDDTSRTTRENALNSSILLNKAGIDEVVLVTHAWHMPRAKAAFERQGLTVMPAPTDFATAPSLLLLDWLPSPRGLQNSYYFFHEALGRIVYALRS